MLELGSVRDGAEWKNDENKGKEQIAKTKEQRHNI